MAEMTRITVECGPKFLNFLREICRGEHPLVLEGEEDRFAVYFRELEDPFAFTVNFVHPTLEQFKTSNRLF